ncbi:unnamed protein product [Allacma fusca]|uniref:Uncharacterized protein n=1 Tax=Allacma fusca TaxID=39272 RepID=A0A8J2PSS6_9HEXA|nr:unnamed protein product [Allacma fusca]
MSNPGRRAAVPNRGNSCIPENILMFSQGFQPQLQNGLSRNFIQEGQFFPADQFPFPPMPGNFNFPVGFFPGQCPMPQPMDALNSAGSFPQHLFAAGRNFPVRQCSPMMLQNMVASSMFPPMGPHFMPWIGQNPNPWLNLNSPWITNNFAQDMNLPWVTRMDPNQTGVFGARNLFPDIVTIDDEINHIPKTEFGHTTETQNFVDELRSSKQVCLKHQKRSADEGTTTAITDENKMDESTDGNGEAGAAAEITTVEKSTRNLGKPLPSSPKASASQNQETQQNIVLIKSSTSCNWKIKSGNALEANPGTSKTYSKSTDPAVAKSPPENCDAAADESIPLKKRKVSFWDRQPVPKKVTVSKKSMTKEDITEAMKVTKAMAEGILRASKPAPKTLADGKLSKDVCILLTDILPKNDDDDASSESSDHSSRYCSSLCTCRCLTEESG